MSNTNPLQATNVGTSENPFYYQAYTGIVNGIWQNTDFQNDSIEFAYYLYLASMYKTGSDNVHNRRLALYYYLKNSEFSTTESTDLIRAMFNTLPTDNKYLRRVINNLANIYINAPVRTVEGKNAEELTELLADASFDNIMLNSHRRAKLCGKCLVRPRIRNNKLNYQILTPDQYGLIKDSYGNIIEFYRPFYEYDPSNLDADPLLRFEHWTNEIFETLDSNWNPVETTVQLTTFENGRPVTKTRSFVTEDNPFGIIPISELSLELNDGDGTDGTNDSYEIVNSQIEQNMLDLLIKENEIFGTLGFLKLINPRIQADNINLSARKALVISDVRTPTDGDLIEPSAEWITQNPVFDMLRESKSVSGMEDMRMAGMPEAMAAGNPSVAASGIALQIDWRELNSMRLEDLPVLRAFENELINLTALFLDKDLASNYKGKFGGEYEVTVDYIEDNYIEPSEKTEQLEEKRRKGLITPENYVKESTGNETITSDEEAIKFINNNLAMFNLIEGEPDDTGTDSTGAEAASGNLESSEGEQPTVESSEDDATDNSSNFETT